MGSGLPLALLTGLLAACASGGDPASDPAGAGASLEAACVREVVEVHAFLEGWFNGELPGDEGTLAGFADALAPGFVIVPPDGGPMDKPTTVAGVRGSHGEREVRIWVEDPVVHGLTDDLYAVCYEEWHERDGARQGRSSRAILRPSSSAPRGVEWVRLEEVWID